MTVQFSPTPLKGAYVIELEPIEDERGSFARTFCRDEFREHGLNPTVVQCNRSTNGRAGTLRGLHYQEAPHEEAKLVRCTGGSAFDVIVDLRPDSDTYTEWYGTRISVENGRMIYAPEGFAHGFLTLEDDTTLHYQMSEAYAPEAATGVRWDDPAFGIEWPRGVEVISENDQSFPDYEPR